MESEAIQFLARQYQAQKALKAVENQLSLLPNHSTRDILRAAIRKDIEERKYDDRLKFW